MVLSVVNVSIPCVYIHYRLPSPVVALVVALVPGLSCHRQGASGRLGLFREGVAMVKPVYADDRPDRTRVILHASHGKEHVHHASLTVYLPASHVEEIIMRALDEYVASVKGTPLARRLFTRFHKRTVGVSRRRG